MNVTNDSRPASAPDVIVEPRGGAITLKTVQQLLAPFNDRYGPTIDVHQAAALGGYEVSTIY